MNGDDPTGVMLILKGFVKVYSISDGGDRYIHIIYKSGELFPLIWAINDVRRRVFYEAASDLTIAEALKDDFLKFLKRDVESMYDVLKQLAQQFYVFADRLDNLQYKSAQERVAYRLMFLASRFGERKGNRVIIKAPLSHEQLGQSINLSRETISREIEKLEKQAIISYQGRFIVVNDIEKLSGEFSEPITLNFWGLKQD